MDRPELELLNKKLKESKGEEKEKREKEQERAQSAPLFSSPGAHLFCKLEFSCVLFMCAHPALFQEGFGGGGS